MDESWTLPAVSFPPRVRVSPCIEEITSKLPSYMNMPNSSGSLFLDSAPDSGSRHGRTSRRRQCELVLPYRQVLLLPSAFYSLHLWIRRYL